MINKISECVDIANKIKQLHDDNYVINISGIDPSVLLQTAAFFEAFTDYESGELRKSVDGRWYRMHTATVGGVQFDCVEYVDNEEKDDGLGRS